MNQQINLYQPIFRKERLVFSAQTITALSIGLVFILAVWSILIGQRLSNLEDELTRQRQAETRLVEQVTRLRSDLPSSEPTPELQEAVARLTEQRQALESGLQALERRMPAGEAGLLRQLDAVAAAVPSGLWLTGLRLADQGRTVEARGNALAPRLVPEWLDRLSRDPGLTGLGFRQVSLDDREDGQPGVRFRVSTEAEDAR